MGQRVKNAPLSTPPVVIAAIPDLIALALAQLVLDRWAAERSDAGAGEGRLRVLEASR